MHQNAPFCIKTHHFASKRIILHQNGSFCIKSHHFASKRIILQNVRPQNTNIATGTRRKIHGGTTSINLMGFHECQAKFTRKVLNFCTFLAFSHHNNHIFCCIKTHHFASKHTILHQFTTICITLHQIT